ncbi:hypothetical protein F4804DRAFT_165978 [Jackrogersella minutella]|nr:hypothetical protein F4804DRAFT_165978 [Jackrogersella minutella]
MGLNILALLCLLVMVKAISIDVQVFTNGQHDKSANCFWSGTSPFCAGSCDSGYSDCGTSGCGDGACCVTGYKKYCCLGGCSGSHALGVEHQQSSKSPETPMVKLDGDNDDICHPKTELLCCPPGAKKNKECTCMKLNAVSQRVNSEKVLKAKGDDHDDLCKPEETLCCNPGAHSNDECGCISSVQG